MHFFAPVASSSGVAKMSTRSESSSPAADKWIYDSKGGGQSCNRSINSSGSMGSVEMAGLKQEYDKSSMRDGRNFR